MKRAPLLWTMTALLVAMAFGSAAWLYPSLPNSIPTHWNAAGIVDGYGPPTTIFIMPAIMAGMVLMFAILPWLSPKPFSVDEFRSTYLIMMLICVAMMGYLHTVVLYGTVNTDRPIGRLLIGGLMFGLAAMGNFMGKIRRNLYVGIKTPWTLASDRVWADTHRIGAWFMTGGGLLGGLACLIGMPVLWSVVVLVVSVLVPVGYSYTHYRALERRGEL